MTCIKPTLFSTCSTIQVIRCQLYTIILISTLNQQGTRKFTKGKTRQAGSLGWVFLILDTDQNKQAERVQLSILVTQVQYFGQIVLSQATLCFGHTRVSPTNLSKKCNRYSSSKSRVNRV